MGKKKRDLEKNDLKKSDLEKKEVESLETFNEMLAMIREEIVGEDGTDV